MNAPMPPPQGAPVAPPQMPAPMPAAGLPAPQPPATHDVTVVSTKKLAQARVMGVPPEEFGIERGARTIADCNYCFHDIVTKTAADLIAEGYDADQVNNLEDYTGNSDPETLQRDTVGEHFTSTSSSTNRAARIVKFTEHYIRMDYDGNGKAQLYQIATAGSQGEILRKDGKECIEPFDAIPFASWTPIPQPHRFFGRSVADLVMPKQREKTALKRGALDNLYLHNNPRVEVAEANAGPNTLDDLLVSRPGGVVRTKTPGGLNWQVVPDITSSIYPMLQYLDGELETSTGLSKQSQGIDANALQNQSATAVAQVFSSSQMRMKLIARLLAEGVKDICALLHGTIRKHGQEAQTVRLRNNWVSVDPRNWKTRNDMTINVGLGTGSKAQQFAQITALMGIQEKLLMGGKTNMVGDTELFNSASEVSKLMGHKNADKFFNDPSAKDPQTGQLLHPPAPPPPSPEMIKGQVQMQIAQSKGQIEQQKAADKAQQEQAKMQADAIHQQVKTQAEAELAKIKADLEAKIAIINAHVKAVEAEQKMRHADAQHQMKMRESAVGMVATAHAHDAKIEQGQQSHQAKLEQMKIETKPKAGE